MKSSCLFVVYLFAIPAAVSAQTFHLRPLDPWGTESVERGMARSPSIRKLSAEIHASDLIVYVQSRSIMPPGVAGMTQLITRTGGYRYVRIAIYRELSPDARAAILGHELQHACELARSTASDSNQVRTLYEAIGRRIPGPKEVFETREAEAVGLCVWFELHGTYSAAVPPFRSWLDAK